MKQIPFLVRFQSLTKNDQRALKFFGNPRLTTECGHCCNWTKFMNAKGGVLCGQDA